MSRRPDDAPVPMIDTAALAGVLIGCAIVAAMFWWPLIEYSWRWWVG